MSMRKPGWRGAVLLAVATASITTLVGFVLGSAWQREAYVKQQAAADASKAGGTGAAPQVSIRGLPESNAGATQAGARADNVPTLDDLRECWTNPKSQRAFEPPLGWHFDGRDEWEGGERHTFVKPDRSARVVLEIIELDDVELSAYVESAKAADEGLARAKWEALHTSGTVQLYLAKSDDGDGDKAIEREYRIWTGDQSLYFRLQIELLRNADDGTRSNVQTIARRVALSSIDRPPSELAGYLF